MYRMFGHLLDRSTLLALIILLITIILIAFHKNLIQKKSFIWRSLCTLPLGLCIIHSIFYNLHYVNFESLALFGIMYISSFFVFIWQFFYNKPKIIYLIWTFTTLIVSLLSFGQVYYKTIFKENLHNLSYYSYTKSFTKSLEILKKEYALNEHKKIDYDYLYKKYYPAIERAEKEENEQLFYKTMYEFSYEIKDAHFNFYINMVSEDDYEKYNFINEYENRDYGFATVLLTDGRLAAILVDEESDAYKNGLRDGMIVTKKDGVPVKELIDEIIAPIDKYPVLEDEGIVKSLWLFSTGKESLDVSFLDESNNEKTIHVTTLPKEKFKYRANEYYYKLFYEEYTQENLTTKMLNETTGYLYVSHEVYDDFHGSMAYLTNDSSYLTDVLESKLSALKDEGMQKLIIDLRGNSGGYNTESTAIASLFTNENYLFTKNAKYKTKRYDKTYLKGLGLFSKLPITVLVDLNTVSAGDALVDALSKNPNVKVVGLTNPNNSCQAVGGYIYLTEGKSYITYPTYNFYEPNGQIFIDTDETRTANVTVDYRIPLTQESVVAIMNEEKDYLLNYVLELS